MSSCSSLLYLIFAFAFFFKPLSCQEQQEPNTDGYFVSDFLKRMHLSPSLSQSYNFSLPVCSWQGIFCDSNSERVIEFVASGLELSGSIPDTTIGKLTKLQTLDLSNNKIAALPADFWSLGSLKSLNLSSNRLSGPLPNDIGNFALLESLDVSNNAFSGVIPETVGSIRGLRILKLDRNRFDQSVPRGVIQCESLVLIDLSSNRLSGFLPDGFGSAFPKLKSLNLAGNEIRGQDSDFSELRSITALNVSSNLFQGSVVRVFKETLEVVDLSKNGFKGHISKVHFNTNNDWSHLIYLDLSKNEFSGEISLNLSGARHLKHLNLASNRFSWQRFPLSLLPFGLEYLNLSRTSLIDRIPVEMSRLSALHTLDLSDNRLAGHIPYLSVKSLRVLDVSINRLTGYIPVPIVDKLPYMERFNFSYNNLTLCSSRLGPEAHEASFFGSSLESCPIAANSSLFRRPAPRRKGLKLALALALSMVFVLAGLLFLAFGRRRKRRSRGWASKKRSSFKEDRSSVSGPFSFQTDSTTWMADVKQASSVPVVIFEKPLLNITFADLLSATSSFDRGTLLADGKFGPVYRGFLPGGIHVAVKVLVHGSTLTDREAARELEYLGRIKHPNLVPLTGYCLAGDQRLAIYDYMENGNLQNLLHDLPLGLVASTTEEDWDGEDGIRPEGVLTTWRFRHKIALGIARALAFLHHGCFPTIVHRDVKASSVYLDYNLEPRVSDFGLAKMFGTGLDEEAARGAPGYLPPEAEADPPTQKSDVYCFGVVLFELVTGKKPAGDEYPEATLVGWVRELVRKNMAFRAIDPKIRDTGPDEQMVEALKIGYLCTADLPSKRPYMQQIVGLLKDIDPTVTTSQ